MRRASVSAWRELEETPGTISPGYVKRRRMKHAPGHRSDPQADASRPKVSSIEVSSTQISPVSLMSPIVTAHSLFSPVEPNSSQRKHFFKQERVKVKSILKTARSLPNVKDGRSLFPFMRYTTVKGSIGGKRGSKRKKVRWADPLVQYVEPAHKAVKAKPRSVSHDLSRELKPAHTVNKTRARGVLFDSGRDLKVSSSCGPAHQCNMNPTQQKKSEISNSLKSHESNAPSTKDESLSETWRTAGTLRGPSLHCSPLSTQQKKVVSSTANSCLSFSSSRFGAARRRSNNSFTMAGSTAVDREKLNMAIMGYPRKSPQSILRKPHDGRRKCVQQFTINKPRRQPHRQSTPHNRKPIR